MARATIPGPVVPIVTGAVPTKPWTEFFRSLVTGQGDFPIIDPATNNTPYAGQSTVFGGHFYICLTDGSWDMVM